MASPPDRPRTAAVAIVEQLVSLGADLAFGVPGESYLAVLDALYDAPTLRFVTCRHENGAAFAAEAHGKLTGRPGLVMVTRGPGVSNASVGIHTAQQDETPLLVLVGQVPRHQRGRDAFQELDLSAMFGSICKWVHELDDPERAPEVIARAWTIAVSGRPGPVMIGLPEDVLVEPCTAPLLPATAPARAAVSPDSVAAVTALLVSAQRPVAIVGGSRWSDAAIAALPVSLPGLPLVAGFRRQDLVDHRIDTFAGALGLGADPALVARVQAADLVIAIGDRLDDPTTNGFTLFGGGTGEQVLVHVHPDPDEHGRVFPAKVAIATDPAGFLMSLGTVPPQAGWASWMAEARAGYRAWSRTEGLLDTIVRGLRDLMPDDAIVTNGAGNFTRPLHRSYTYHRPGRQLAPVSGSMGYGLPAAIAAKLTYPDRAVVCVAGDGDLMMTVQELATAAHEHLAIVVLVVDNGAYGTIRSHQERKFPGRPFATALTNPDFVAFARSFGMHAERTTDSDDTIAALARAVGSRRAALVHLVTD